MRNQQLARAALVIIAILALAGVLGGCRSAGYNASDVGISINGRTATVSVTSSTELSVTLDGQVYTYRSTPTDGGTSCGVSGPADAPAADYELVNQVVSQWLNVHPQWEHPQRINAGMVFGGLFIAGLGVLSLLKPATIWYISDGWKFRNAEPSDAALVMTRIGGVVMVIVGLIMIGNPY